MFNKVTTIVILILVFLMIGLVIITLSNRSKVNNQPNPISFSTEDSVDIAFTPNTENPKYVYIKDDHIYINYTDESYMPVKLEKKGWAVMIYDPQEIRYSWNGTWKFYEDGKLVKKSVYKMGEEVENQISGSD